MTCYMQAVFTKCNGEQKEVENVDAFGQALSTLFNLLLTTLSLTMSAFDAACSGSASGSIYSCNSVREKENLIHRDKISKRKKT